LECVILIVDLACTRLFLDQYFSETPPKILFQQYRSLADKPSRTNNLPLSAMVSKSGQTRVRRNCPLRAIRRHSLAPLECPQSVVSRYLISTTGIAQHHAVAATHMDAFAEIIRSHARFSSNPDLITSQRA